MLNLRNLFALAGLAVAAMASANVSGYGISFYMDHQQNSDLPPTDPPAIFEQATITLNTDNYFTAAELEFPTATSEEFAFAPPNFFIRGTQFDNLGDMEANRPAGDYTFRALAGPGAPQTAVLNVANYNFPDTTPYLDGGTWTAMTTTPADVDVEISWPKFGSQYSADQSTISFQLVDLTDGFVTNLIVSGFVGDIFGATIPAIYRRSGRHYFMVQTYATSYLFPSAGFGGAFAGYSFLRRNNAFFQVPASPGTIAGQLTLESVGNPQGDPVEVEILDLADNVVQTHSIFLGWMGYFAIETGLAGGPYRARFKGKHHISNSDVFDIASGVGNVALTLKNGDIDNDNSVTIFDYIELSLAFGKTRDDADFYTPGPSGFAPFQSDIDRDFEVTIFDYIILSGNFDELGS